METITLVVNTRNESEHIGDLLDSLSDVDAAVIGDMESTDGTQQIAAQRGATVLELDNAGYCEPGRQAVIDAVKAGWILLLDADERLPPGGLQRLRDIAASATADTAGYTLTRRTYFGKFRVRASGWEAESERTLRFFRSGTVEWPARIHAPPEARGAVHKIADDDVWIDHFAFRDLGHFCEKTNRYASVEAKDLAADLSGSIGPTFLLDGLEKAADEVTSRYSPTIDGPLSLAASIGIGGYVLFKHLKAAEMSGWRPVLIPTASALSAGMDALIEHLRADTTIAQNVAGTDSTAATDDSGASEPNGASTHDVDPEANTEPAISTHGEYASRKLHLGCGGNVMDGWINADIGSGAPGVVQVDATKPMPFADGSMDYVFSEHMIEHIPYSDGAFMASECSRILAPGGVLRLATPDWSFLTALLQRPHDPLHARYIKWATDLMLPDAPSYDATFVVNNYVRAWGHTFIYSEATLRSMLERAGFARVVVEKCSESTHAALRGLEHVDRMPAGFLALETLVVEAHKETAPSQPASSRAGRGSLADTVVTRVRGWRRTGSKHQQIPGPACRARFDPNDASMDDPASPPSQLLGGHAIEGPPGGRFAWIGQRTTVWLTAPATDRTLQLRGWLPVDNLQRAHPGERPVEVSLLVNRRIVATARFDQDSEVSMAVETTIPAGRAAEVGIHVSHAYRPIDLQLNGDTRSLALMLFFVGWP